MYSKDPVPPSPYYYSLYPGWAPVGSIGTVVRMGYWTHGGEWNPVSEFQTSRSTCSTAVALQGKIQTPGINSNIVYLGNILAYFLVWGGAIVTKVQNSGHAAGTKSTFWMSEFPAHVSPEDWRVTLDTGVYVSV